MSHTERMDAGDGLGSGEKIYQLGRSEQGGLPMLVAARSQVLT